MSVLIKGLNINQADGLQFEDCHFIHFSYGYKLHIGRKVYPVCEIPTPHGRLIDADAHIQSLKENQCGERCRKNHDCVNCGIGMYIRIVENEPTIIEAVYKQNCGKSKVLE